MNLNFKRLKYFLPLVCLPFLCLFFYVYHNRTAAGEKATRPPGGINGSVGEVSAAIKKKKLSDKLDAFRNTYREPDGFTTVNPIQPEHPASPAFNNATSDLEKRMLDSIDGEMIKRYGLSGGRSSSGIGANRKALSYKRGTAPRSASYDKALASTLASLSSRQSGVPQESCRRNPAPPPKEEDPMAVFKQQLAYMDSLGKAGDPAYKAEKQKQAALAMAEDLRLKEKKLKVRKTDDLSSDFNTLLPEKKTSFIRAIIDENVTGYAGSRVRIRLLQDIKAGDMLIIKGTYLYALISGFSGQRAMLSVGTILYQDKLLPVKLDVYDLDGLAGLYVPGSAFRDFTRDLGGNSIQGVSLDGSGQNGGQFLMSSASKIFQSTSSAMAGLIRRNKVNLKYNSYLYLIDPDALQNAQRTY
jgi:conjugative transposon TraM protein